jgi:hypothetical protein
MCTTPSVSNFKIICCFYKHSTPKGVFVFKRKQFPSRLPLQTATAIPVRALAVTAAQAKESFFLSKIRVTTQ